VRRRIPLSVSILIALLFIISATVYWERNPRPIPEADAFIRLWAAARITLTDGNTPYGTRGERQIENLSNQAALGRYELDPETSFPYPLPTLILYGPLGLLQYPIGRAAWTGLLGIGLLVTAFLGLRLTNWQLSPWGSIAVLLFAAFWFHGVFAAVVGQIGVLGAVLIFGGLSLIKDGSDFGAGVLFALTLLTPQMGFLLIPFVLLWSISVRRPHVLGGFFGTVVIITILSVLIFPSWPLEWIQQSIGFFSNSALGSLAFELADSMPGIRTPLLVFFHVLVIGYLVLEWILALRKDELWFLWTSFLTLALTTLVVFPITEFSYSALLPGLFLILKVWQERWAKLGNWGVWLVLLLIGIGLWAIYLSLINRGGNMLVLYIPIPLFTIVGLWWTRWWAINPPHLLLDDLRAHLDQ
jgi:hypothetical protein